MHFKLAVLPGDGIGTEVTAEAVKVLEAVGVKFGHTFEFTEALVGGIAIDKTGNPLPDETLALCKASDSVLFGAIGTPKYDDPKLPVRPEQGLLALRKGLGLYANLRPVKVFPQLVSASTLKEDVIRGVDMLVVRELTGGLYFGQPSKVWRDEGGRKGVDSMYYTEQEIARVVRTACELALKRRKKVTSVDKANVLNSSRLWREIATEVSHEYPDVEFEHMLVDTCAMRFVRSPKIFDVVVMENTFGDILTDEASTLAGSMGMLPSASLAEGKFGLYEPIHGSSPNRAGKNTANPIATILSGAMMLDYSFGLAKEAKAIESAIEATLNAGQRTNDITDEGCTVVGTREMGDLIAGRVMAG
jgi:3-isopropylmalate dehydrogenase